MGGFPGLPEVAEIFKSTILVQISLFNDLHFDTGL